MIDKSHPVSAALKKAKISTDLKTHFKKFLIDFPNLQSQAIYLLRDKKDSIENVIAGLFGVPVDEQVDWKSEDENEEKVDEELQKIFDNYEKVKQQQKFLEKFYQFSDWKLFHGLESKPLEAGETNMIIRINPVNNETQGRGLTWSFYRSRYGKRGWSSEKILKDLGDTILDYNNSPGKGVKKYLEDIYHLRNKVEEKPNQLYHLPNPIFLNMRDSHALLFLLLGHPHLYLGNDHLPLKNSQKNCEFNLSMSKLPEYRILWGNLSMMKDGKAHNVNIDEFDDYLLLFPGNPLGVIHDRRYYTIEENILSLKMMKSSFRGIMVTNDDWPTFSKLWPEHYPHIELKEVENENEIPSISSRNVKEWSFWFNPPETSVSCFQNENDAVKIILDTKDDIFVKDQIPFNFENLTDWKIRIQNREKVAQSVELLSTIDKIIQDRDTVKGRWLLNNVEAALVLSLSSHYPYIYNEKKEALLAEEQLKYKITIKKRQDIQGYFALEGDVQILEDRRLKSIAIKSSDAKKGKHVLPSKSIGFIPSYFLRNGKIHQVGKLVNSYLVNDSLLGVTIKENEIAEFYATAIPYMKQRGILISDPEGLLRVSALFNYVIHGEMNVWEVHGLLMGRLKIKAITDIGEFPYPMYSGEDEFQQIIDGMKYQIPRNHPMEQALIDRVYEHGWLDEGKGEFSMHENTTMKFFMETLVSLPDDTPVSYYGLKRLKKWAIEEVVPTINTKIKTNIDWFDVDIQIEYEGKNIDIKKILEFWQSPKEAIEMKGREGLVIINKEWLAKYAPILNRLMQTYKNNPDGAPQELLDSFNMKVDKYHVSLIGELEKAALIKETDKAWKNIVKKLNNYKEQSQINIPDTVKANLRDYQKDGVRWLCFLREFLFGGILADDMGLGKTLQTLAFLDICKSKGGFKGPNLVIAPTSVVSNWINEINKFVPHFKSILLHGGGRKSLFDKVKGADLVITTYGLLQRDMAILKGFEFDLLILDEAQMIKNNRSKTNLSVLQLKSRMRLSLTGTPIENSVSELWSQFNFLMPGFLGNIKNFHSLYINTFQKNSEKKKEAFAFLRRQTRPFILRRMKQHVAKELPPKTEQTLYCEMTEGQRRLYNNILDIVRETIKDKISDVGFQQAKVTIFDALTRLRQICSDPRLSPLSGEDPPMSGKFQLFLSTIEKIVEEGHRVLVFSHFVKMLNLMHAHLREKKIPFLQLDGGTKDRAEVVRMFQEEGRYPVLLISLKAGGTGINLTAADYVIHYDPWWNPASEAQATDRAYRIGQLSHVFVYKLITKNSIEEKVLELQQKKLAIAEKIVGISDSIETMLDLDNIKEIFQI